jgi:hypothetical protein
VPFVGFAVSGIDYMLLFGEYGWQDLGPFGNIVGMSCMRSRGDLLLIVRCHVVSVCA